LGGADNSKLYSFHEANTICTGLGYRLCTRAELEAEDSSGCCNDNCGLDRKLVWTACNTTTTENWILRERVRDLSETNGDLWNDYHLNRDQTRALKDFLVNWQSDNPELADKVRKAREAEKEQEEANKYEKLTPREQWALDDLSLNTKGLVDMIAKLGRTTDQELQQVMDRVGGISESDWAALGA